MPDIPALREVVSQVVASPYSDFYRRLYGVLAGSIPHIYSMEDWQLLPYFTKDVLLSRPMREYTYVPRAKVDIITQTSGTSGKPPIFVPRYVATDTLAYRRNFYQNPRACLNSLIVAQHRNDLFLVEYGGLPRTIQLDLKNLEACIALAKAAHVDSVGVHTFTIHAVAEEMKRQRVTEQIKLIDLIGETVSRSLYTYLCATFPNAKIISSYGFREAEGLVGYPCRAFSNEEPYPIYHVQPDFHIDLISKDGEPVEIKTAVEADILVTDINFPRGLPLLRYRVGDTVRVVEEKCKEHGMWTFTVLGKSDADFMLIPGGQLRADEIERVLRTMPTLVTDRFEMHRYDVGDAIKPTIRALLKVTLVEAGVDLAVLATRIQKELRISPTENYEKGVAAGYYEPLVCEPLVSTADIQKHKRMVRH